METQRKNVKRILVIKHRHLGDILLSSPVFTHLKKHYPQAEIHAYIGKEAKEILLDHPTIDHLYLYDRKWKSRSLFRRIFYELKILQALKKNRYDMVINLTEGDRGILAAWFCQAKIRVSFAPKNRWMKRLLTHLVKSPSGERHTVERDLDALRVLGIFPKTEERDLVFAISDDAIKKAIHLTGKEFYIVMQATSRWRFKCPPPELMAKVCDLLPFPIFLTGSEGESEFVEQIAMLSQKEVINLAGKTNLKEMGALLKGSVGLITVDSLALHMASALKVPVVALFGPTSEKNWGPWMHPFAEVVTKDYPCRPCRLDGCGGSKRSDCLYMLSPTEIVAAFHRVTSAAAVGASF